MKLWTQTRPPPRGGVFRDEKSAWKRPSATRGAVLHGTYLNALSPSGGLTSEETLGGWGQTPLSLLSFGLLFSAHLGLEKQEKAGMKNRGFAHPFARKRDQEKFSWFAPPGTPHTPPHPHTQRRPGKGAQLFTKSGQIEPNLTRFCNQTDQS